MKIKVYKSIDEVIAEDIIKCEVNKDTKYLLRRSQKIRDEICKHLKMRKVPLIINDTNNGFAHPSGKITIPIYVLDYGEPYIIYMVCHEICHIFCRPRENHGYIFKNVEWKTLMELYKIEIIYKRAYPKILKRDGKEVYVDTKEKMRREE